jgi:hypothetical protein
MKTRLFNVLSGLAVCTLVVAPAARGEDVQTPDARSESDASVVKAEIIANDDAPVHIHLTRDAAAEAAATASRDALARRSANMTYHGGKIMPSASVKSIFWGKKWGTSSFFGDKITGLDSFYTGFNQSNYAVTSDEYTGSNGHVGPSIFNMGHVVDAFTASGGNSTSAILAEACKQFTGPNDGTAYYAVYTDVRRGNAGYCAYHSSGSCGGVTVRFAFFWDLDGDSGCDPGDTSSVHSQGLEALANVSAHELSEARTDPGSPGGWYDSSGAENGDKCAWTFNVPHVSFTNGSSWKLQGEWSNAAYTAGTGYPNSSGQRGCLDGH